MRASPTARSNTKDKHRCMFHWCDQKQVRHVKGDVTPSGEHRRGAGDDGEQEKLFKHKVRDLSVFSGLCSAPDKNKPAETQSRLLHLHPRCPEKETKRLKLQKHSLTSILNKTPSSINFIHFSSSVLIHMSLRVLGGTQTGSLTKALRETEVEEKK